jgi:hypothetical protein
MNDTAIVGAVNREIAQFNPPISCYTGSCHSRVRPPFMGDITDLILTVRGLHASGHQCTMNGSSDPPNLHQSKLAHRCRTKTDHDCKQRRVERVGRLGSAVRPAGALKPSLRVGAPVESF